MERHLPALDRPSDSDSQHRLAGNAGRGAKQLLCQPSLLSHKRQLNDRKKHHTHRGPAASLSYSPSIYLSSAYLRIFSCLSVLSYV